MQKDGHQGEIRTCPVCKENIFPHETALFFSGRDNLVQMRLGDAVVLIHRECADSFETRSDLLRFLTNGKSDLSWLE
ncbi:MAG: hypothetical protein GXO69_01750 [Acidobacteria bacterium]|nr:hypothetical protein [Acidobacteriota bacterium]